MGLAISYALSITYDLSGFMNVFTESEKQLISVERLNQSIKDTPKEDPATNLVRNFYFLQFVINECYIFIAAVFDA